MDGAVAIFLRARGPAGNVPRHRGFMVGNDFGLIAVVHSGRDVTA